MSSAGDASSAPRSELRVVGTTVAREIELLLDRVAHGTGKRVPRVLQVGSRSLVSDRNERNWRGLIAKRFARGSHFVGVDLFEGTNVDHVLDICSPTAKLVATLGKEAFDLVICSHVLEHTLDPGKAARNIQELLRPGGIAYIATPWSQAFHATPDDYWRFSVRGLMVLFGKLDIVGAFYSGGDVGLDVAARAGAVEQGLFQIVLDHEDNRAVLARQATERLPVSRTYLPTLFVNLIGQRPV